MAKPNYFYNIIPFDPPFEGITLYFTDQELPEFHRAHIKLLPDNVVNHFKESNPDLEFLYTSFTDPKEGFTDFKLEKSQLSISLQKRYFTWLIENYFQNQMELPTRIGFINECQVWVPTPKQDTEQFHLYMKFSIRVQFATVTDRFELLLSYQGQSKVLKQNAVELTHAIGSDTFNWVLYNGQLHKWEPLISDESIRVNHEEVNPILNKDIERALNLPVEIPRPSNKYKKYLDYITKFYKRFLLTDEFKSIIPLDDQGFFRVPKSKVFQTTTDSNLLEFGDEHVNDAPKYALKDNPPFEPSRLGNTTMFFIMHRKDIENAKKLKAQFEDGFKWFGGLYDYVDLVLNVQPGLSIVFDNEDNPLPEIEQKLATSEFKPGVTYIAIYLTPIDKYTNDLQKREVYYKVKELLLKRDITSQAINPTKMLEQGKNWVYSLPNIAIAMLAKLDGIPWRLDTPIKSELIVGVGAFLHQKENVKYIGSSFSFTNDGRFNRFEYFQKDEIDILAGSIAESVKEFATLNQDPKRLVIHFYKTMSQRELNPIIKELKELDLNIPVFIVTINKTESQDIVAFDADWSGRMPKSGTIMNIGYNKYLLFNNTRYSNVKPTVFDGYPFPVKIKIQCSDPELVKDVKTVKELIDQVYQFSRMYWKSLRQQNLPVTIKYPEMVAQIAPHFESEDIPPFGKSNLWFL